MTWSGGVFANPPSCPHCSTGKKKNISKLLCRVMRLLLSPRHEWSHQAADDYLASNRYWLQFLAPRIKDEFRVVLQAQTIGAACKVWQQKEAKKWCYRNWPARESKAEVAVEENASWEMSSRDQVDLREMRYGCSHQHKMLTEQAVAGLMGIPFFIVRRLGGVEKLADKCTPEQWAQFRNVGEIFIPLSGNGYRLQTNLRAVLSWSTIPIACSHMDRKRVAENSFVYVYMGNGAGKTHICRTMRGTEDKDRVWMDAEGPIRLRAEENCSKMMMLIAVLAGQTQNK